MENKFNKFNNRNENEGSKSHGRKFADARVKQATGLMILYTSIVGLFCACADIFGKKQQNNKHNNDRKKNH